MITIDQINHATGQETLHPLICIVDSPTKITSDSSDEACDFYSLTIGNLNLTTSLHLSIPGDHLENMSIGNGVYFHADLLCDTPLEKQIGSYPRRCRCRSALSADEQALITNCFSKIKSELNHPIDRFSATILSSHLELLLNYCVRICN